MEQFKRVLAGPWVPPELGKLPFLWASSLTFMLWQYFFKPPSGSELLAVAATVILFLPLYLYSFWVSGTRAVVVILLTCLIGIVWAPWNTGAGTMFVFAAGMCGRLAPGPNGYRMLALVLGLATAAGYLLSPMRFLFLLAPWMIGTSVGIGSIMEAGLRASRRALHRKQEEVEHIARIAERERISRDLHDLLGHSLSLIAVKAELAGKLANKLAGRDIDACKREIADIEASARRALAEVRTAVTGYRDSGLPGALASARASLAAAGVELREDIAQFALAPALEHVLALALREAVTNVVRHAGATRCAISLAREEGGAVLRVLDNGDRLRDGDEIRVGNGLSGMRERAASVGGRLVVSVENGLRLELRLPVKDREGEAA